MTKFTDEDLTVYLNDQPLLRLNGNLAERQKITKEQLYKLKELHVDRYLTEKQLEEASRIEDIQMLFQEWTRINFEQQDNWNFPRDASWHPSHRLSHCLCPKLDGDDRLGSKFAVRTSGCPIHDPL